MVNGPRRCLFQRPGIFDIGLTGDEDLVSIGRVGGEGAQGAG